MWSEVQGCHTSHPTPLWMGRDWLSEGEDYLLPTHKWICVGGLSSHWCAPPTPGPMGKVKRGRAQWRPQSSTTASSSSAFSSPGVFFKPQSGREDLKQYCYILKCNSALSSPSRGSSLLPHPTERGKTFVNSFSAFRNGHLFLEMYVGEERGCDQPPLLLLLLLLSLSPTIRSCTSHYLSVHFPLP